MVVRNRLRGREIVYAGGQEQGGLHHWAEPSYRPRGGVYRLAAGRFRPLRNGDSNSRHKGVDPLPCIPAVGGQWLTRCPRAGCTTKVRCTRVVILRESARLTSDEGAHIPCNPPAIPARVTMGTMRFGPTISESSTLEASSVMAGASSNARPTLETLSPLSDLGSFRARVSRSS